MKKELIFQILNELNLTQSELASELGVHQSTISRILMGKSQGTTIDLATLLDYGLADDDYLLASIADKLFIEWNKNYPNPDNPKHISRAEIQRRLEIGIENGRTIEELELY
tara:strand:+ start:185 stop:517 length:333 start_codon:yes stop_codon:yes gene_type:complete